MGIIGIGYRQTMCCVCVLMRCLDLSRDVDKVVPGTGNDGRSLLYSFRNHSRGTTRKHLLRCYRDFNRIVLLVLIHYSIRMFSDFRNIALRQWRLSHPAVPFSLRALINVCVQYISECFLPWAADLTDHYICSIIHVVLYM